MDDIAATWEDEMDNKHDFLRDLLIVILFFGAVGLIAWGLRMIFRPLMWIFLGTAAMYLAVCVSRTGEK